MLPGTGVARLKHGFGIPVALGEKNSDEKNPAKMAEVRGLPQRTPGGRLRLSMSRRRRKPAPVKRKKSLGPFNGRCGATILPSRKEKTSKCYGSRQTRVRLASVYISEFLPANDHESGVTQMVAGINRARLVPGKQRGNKLMVAGKPKCPPGICGIERSNGRFFRQNVAFRTFPAMYMG